MLDGTWWHLLVLGLRPSRIPPVPSFLQKKVYTTVFRLGLWAKVVSRGRGLGETLSGFCGGGAVGRGRAFTAFSAFVVFLDVCSFAEACGRCGEFWAKAFVGFGGRGRQKRSCGERKIWLN